MAKCSDCGREMMSAKSCTVPKLVVNGRVLKRVIHKGEFSEKGQRCHDCNIKYERGNIHHFGCDMERCPNCGGQLISCGCSKKLYKLKKVM